MALERRLDVRIMPWGVDWVDRLWAARLAASMFLWFVIGCM
jgi:hypothetical protein